jgi:ATP-binding cassette subfamily F protein uup
MVQMSKLILSLENITLTFGGKPLFENLSLHISEGDKICLVGKNGAGKTTLMKLLTENLELDAGRRFVMPATTIGYLPQVVEAAEGQNVRDFVLSGLPIEERHAEQEYRAEMVISPLGLDADALMQPLSGGQKRRAALARALVTDPDILLLDEPTNHLDLTAIEWLEDYLKSYRGALICVSHDRRFLANISRKVFWIDRGQVKTCPFGYGQFEEWLEEILEQEARELQNLRKKVEAEHDWTQGGVTGRRKRNVRRLRELHQLRDKLRSDKAAFAQRRQKIEMDALETPNASKILAEFKDVSKSFLQDGKRIPILQNFNHLILKGDRLGILGHNGSGKSSFVKLLAKELEADAGNIFRSKTIDISYFDQNRSLLDPDKTLWQTLCPEGGQNVFLGSGAEQQSIHVCGYLKRFLFDPKQANEKVGTLSGGQQNRLLLARILAKPGNLLILDEPTNDLDMDTLDMLQEMLADYMGTLIIVSHDRDFLDRTVTEILAFEGDAKVFSVIGGYSDYLREKQHRAMKSAVPSASAPAVAMEKKANPSSTPLAPKPKPLTFGEKLELDKLPDQIDKLQKKLDALQQQLDEAGIDPSRLTLLLEDYNRIQRNLTTHEERWLELEERQLTGG